MEAYDYIKDNLAGYPFNAKHPPNYEQNGGLYHGYKNNSEETFYYDFAVQRYDLRFNYNGTDYYFLSEQDYAAQCDEHFTNKFAVSGMAMLFLKSLKLMEES